MSDPKNTNERNNNKPALTTDSLQVVGAKAKDPDIYGLVLDHKDINEAVAKALVKAGIDPDAILGPIVGVSDQGPKSKIKIYAELDVKKLKNTKETGNFFTDAFNYDESDNYLPSTFYKALSNKAYHKHLNEKIFVRKSKKGNTRKVLSIEFDPSIFIAFAWDIEFDDYYYILKPIYLNDGSVRSKDKRYKDMSDKERKYQKILEARYRSYNLKPCNIMVLYSKNNNGGFHPNQVTKYD